MDYFTARQPIGVGHLALTRGAPVKPTAFVQQAGAGGPVYGSVDTSATQKRTVGGIDNGIDIKRSYIAFDHFYFLHIQND